MSGEILDVTFRLLSICSAARDRHLQRAGFSERIIAGLYEYIAAAISALSFSY